MEAANTLGNVNSVESLILSHYVWKVNEKEYWNANRLSFDSLYQGQCVNWSIKA